MSNSGKTVTAMVAALGAALVCGGGALYFMMIVIGVGEIYNDFAFILLFILPLVSGSVAAFVVGRYLRRRFTA